MSGRITFPSPEVNPLLWKAEWKPRWAPSPTALQRLQLFEGVTDPDGFGGHSYLKTAQELAPKLIDQTARRIEKDLPRPGMKETILLLAIESLGSNDLIRLLARSRITIDPTHGLARRMNIGTRSVMLGRLGRMERITFSLQFRASFSLDKSLADLSGDPHYQSRSGLPDGSR